MGIVDPQPAFDEDLQDLVVEVLERIERDGSRALDEACRAHPEHAAGLRKRIIMLRELGLVESWSADRPPERLGDFRLLECMGAGGMGVVYHAIQESLGRDVALKLIRPEMLFMPGARQRFARETAIVARLQHPGIVPIYTVGGADELPYYAMERVPGCTLAEALADLAGRPSERPTGGDLVRAARARTSDTPDAAAEPSSLFSGSWEQISLCIIRQVAEALEHAHGRGVLHRDLKPSNVMITPGGRVMLVDFGLSQREGGDTVTRSGERAGSFPYMAPELLEQGLRAFDQRSDVYSLGVTLYQLLTLRLPFAAESEPALLAQILEGRPRRPRALASEVSWEAETVCLAAMERDPARRYATAADFARDIGNALERRPVEARRASPWLRARRWVETRPGAAAAIVLAVLLPTAIAALKVREARAVGRALADTQEQRNLAETNFERSLRAVDEMLRRVGAESLDHVPGSDALRIELFGEALELYAELERERPDDQRLASLAAECVLWRSTFLNRQARHDQAAAELRELLDRPEPPIEASTYELRRTRARALAQLANAQPDPEEGAALRNVVLDAFGALVRERPDDPELVVDIAKTLANVVTHSRGSGDRERLGELDRPEQLARQIQASSPSPAAEKLLADVLEMRGALLARDGRPADARAPMEEGLALRRSLLGRDPSDERARNDLVRCASGLASVLGALERAAEALELLELAVRESERNRADFPDVVEFSEQAADVELNRGAALGRLGLEAESRQAGERAAAILVEILDRHPENPNLHQRLGTTLLNLTETQLLAGESAAALVTCARSLEQFEAALAISPLDPDLAAWLAPERSTRAKVLLALGRTAEAAEALAEAPRLAGHRAQRASHCLNRMADCLERARAEGDPATLTRCALAARRALDLALERGDLGADPALARLCAMLDAQ